MSLNPLMVAGMGLTLMSGMASHAAEEATYNANRTQQERVAADAVRQTIEDYDQIERMRQEERASAVQRDHQNEVEALQRRGAITAAAGDAGLGGVGLDALLRDVFRQAGVNRDAINQNLQNTNQQLTAEAHGLRRQAQSRINGMPPLARPSLAATALRTGTGLLTNYQLFKIGS